MLEKSTGKSRVVFPQGQVLIDLAGEYSTVHEVVLELVANELDANGTEIWIIDDRVKRKITVAGNGDGMNKDGFDKAFRSVRSSMKDRTKFGQHGLGFISALGKCESARYISHSRKRGGWYMEYVLNTEDVREQVEEVFVPHNERRDLVHASAREKPGEATVVGWNTLVEISKYSKDPYIYGIKGAKHLADTIEERYGESMRKRAAKVHILIRTGKEEDKATATGKRYAGRRIGTATPKRKDGGNIVIDLYVAKQSATRKLGQVKVGQIGNDYRLSFKEMIRNAPGFISDEVVEGLASGVFEGEILFEFDKPKLLKSRKGFEQDEMFVESCILIDQWFEAYGRQYLNVEKETRSAERYQELGKALLKNIEEMPLLSDVVKKFTRGTVGTGHYDPEQFSPVGEQEQKSVSIHTTPVSESSGEGGGQSGGSPKRDRSEHHPLTVIGPKGQRRTIVRSGSTGLQIAHDQLQGSSRRWELDSRNGILTFNVRHPDWLDLERNKRKIMQYQVMLTIHAFTLETLPEEWDRTPVELAFDTAMTQHVHQIRAFE